MALRCSLQEQAPVPGSGATAVRYPACVWVDAQGEVDDTHPLNRYVCSWLTSDVSEVSRCDEVLAALSQLEAAQRPSWFADGDAFQVDMHPHGVQFNPSHIGPDDTAYWNQDAGQFSLREVTALLCAWRAFLVGLPSP